MVELDQYKQDLAACAQPLIEVRDSLLTWLAKKIGSRN